MKRFAIVLLVLLSLTVYATLPTVTATLYVVNADGTFPSEAPDTTAEVTYVSSLNPNPIRYSPVSTYTAATGAIVWTVPQNSYLKVGCSAVIGMTPPTNYSIGTSNVVLNDLISGTPPSTISSTYIPYIGATKNADLGSRTITTTGKGTFGAFKLTTGAGLNYLLVSDADGDGTWQEADYLKRDGSNANTDIDLGSNDLTINGNITMEHDGIDNILFMRAVNSADWFGIYSSVTDTLDITDVINVDMFSHGIPSFHFMQIGGKPGIANWRVGMVKPLVYAPSGLGADPDKDEYPYWNEFNDGKDSGLDADTWQGTGYPGIGTSGQLLKSTGTVNFQWWTPDYLSAESDPRVPAHSTMGNLMRSTGSDWESWTPNYLSAEADTLSTVTGRGASTTNAITFGGASPLVFDGATAGTYTTTFSFTDPTSSNKTITFPNATGTVPLLESSNTWTGTYQWFKQKLYIGSNLTTPSSTHDNTFVLIGDGVANDLTLGAADTTAYGIYAYPYITLQSNLSTFMNMKSVSKYMDDGTARTITNGYGLYVTPPQKAAGAQAGTAITNLYTLYVEDPISGGSSTNTGIYNGGSLVNVRKIQTGVDSLDGQIDIYSEQGATDYTASIKPHAAMTSNMTLYLPADEPTATLPVTVTSGGQIGYKTDYNPDNARPAGWPQTAANAQDNEFSGEKLTVTGTCDIVHNGTGTSTVTSTAGDAFAPGDDGKLLYLAGIPYTIDSVTSTSIVEVTEAGALPANASGVTYIVGRAGYWTWDKEGSATDAAATTYNQTTYAGNLYIDNGGAQYNGGVYGYFTKLLATPDADNFTITMKVGFPPNNTNGIGLAVTEAGGTNPFGLLVNFVVSPTNGHYDVRSFTGTTAWENNGTVATKAIYAAPFQYLRIQRIGTGANQLLMAVSMDGMNWIEVVSTGFTMANPLTNVGVIMSLPAEAAAGANHPSVTVDWIRFE